MTRLNLRANLNSSLKFNLHGQRSSQKTSSQQSLISKKVLFLADFKQLIRTPIGILFFSTHSPLKSTKPTQKYQKTSSHICKKKKQTNSVMEVVPQFFGSSSNRNQVIPGSPPCPQGPGPSPRHHTMGRQNERNHRLSRDSLAGQEPEREPEGIREGRRG